LLFGWALGSVAGLLEGGSERTAGGCDACAPAIEAPNAHAKAEQEAAKKRMGALLASAVSNRQSRRADC
jgi:hypothetical protein